MIPINIPEEGLNSIERIGVFFAAVVIGLILGNIVCALVAEIVVLAFGFDFTHTWLVLWAVTSVLGLMRLIVK